VLDASALLALINHETGAEIVANLLPNAAMSSVNFGEVVAKLTDSGWTEAEIREGLNSLMIDVIAFDQDLAY
jgi:PIN domain nuclease of toxin-antitoxin system